MSKAFTQIVDLQNSGSKARELWIEPWGDRIMLPVKKQIRVVAEGPVGNVVVDFTDDTVTIYAWPGSTLAIQHEDELLWECSLAAPLSMPPAAEKRK